MRVFIAEDSAPIGERLCAMLAEFSCFEVVGQAADVIETEEAIARLKPDAVILDLQLATGSGLTVLRDLRRYDRSTLVIVVTNHASSHYRNTCFAEGADYFIDKSTEFESIPNTLMRAGSRDPERDGETVERASAPRLT